LEEIETVLKECSGLEQAVVALLGDTPEDMRLVAYVVTTAGGNPEVSSWKNVLKKRLPEYMVPTVFINLDELPITANGKVDRKALPRPGRSGMETQETFVPPRNPMEESLIKIWRQILKLERVGIHESFFEIGGHSLLALLLISRVREEFQVELSVRSMFEAPTIAGMAETIEKIFCHRLENLSDHEAEALIRQS